MGKVGDEERLLVESIAESQIFFWAYYEKLRYSPLHKKLY